MNVDRLFVATVTPYKRGTFDVDETGLRRLLRYFAQPRFVAAGAGLIINPEAGEIFYLSREEKRRNVEIAVEELGGTMPVFAGVIAATTAESVEVARDAQAAGAQGLFLMPPVGSLDITGSWNADLYPEVWVDMAKEICDAVDLPAIVHPVASITPAWGIGLPLSATLKMLDALPNIVGWKMTYPYNAYRRIARALRNYPRHVSILASSAGFYHEFLATGQFDGTVTGSFNYGLERMLDHLDAWRQGDVTEARRIWDAGLAELHEFVYGDYSRLHIRYKIACWLRGLIDEPYMRPPQPRPKDEEVQTLYRLLRQAGFEVISEEAVKQVGRTPALAS